MHTHVSATVSPPQPDAAARLLLREARHLHKAAVQGPLIHALPVLRRLIATRVMLTPSLPELLRTRQTVQRKHVLRMLAVEAGFPAWEPYRVALRRMLPSELPHFDVIRHAVGYPNLWFSTMEEAQAHVLAHGGRAMRVGVQAVVIEHQSLHN